MIEKHFFNEWLMQDLEKLGYKKVVNKHGVVIYTKNDEDGFITNIFSDKNNIYVSVGKKYSENSVLGVRVYFENTDRFKLSLRNIKYVVGQAKLEIESKIKEKSV